MTDRIELRGLRLLGRHGALEGEQDAAQPFEIDLEVEADFAEAAADDDLAKTVDYSLVVEKATEIVGAAPVSPARGARRGDRSRDSRAPARAGSHGDGPQAPAPCCGGHGIRRGAASAGRVTSMPA